MLDPRQILATNFARLVSEDPRKASRKDIADQTGVGRRSIGKLEKKEIYPQLDTIDALARYFRKEPWQLLAPNLGEDLVQTATPEIRPGYIRLPRLDVEFSAGDGTSLMDHVPVLEHLDVLEDWLRQGLGVLRPERIQIVNVRGDSMAPTINPGDIAFVDPLIQRFTGEGIYVMDWNSELLIKRLAAETDGRLGIYSDNPAPAYRTKYVAAQQLDTLQIAGRVVGWWTLKRN